MTLHDDYLEDIKIFAVEDEMDSAQDGVKHLDLKLYLPEVAYIDNYETLCKLIVNEVDHNVYIVDINLGQGRENEGIKVIKKIKQEYPKSLIIARTAYGDKKKNCIEAGADHFILKGGNYDNDILQMREIILEFLIKIKYINKVCEFTADVAHVEEDEGWVKLECAIEGRIIPKIFSLEFIQEAINEDIVIDTRLKFQYLRRGKQTRYSISKEYIISNDELFNDDDDDLLDSEMWSNKI